MAIIPVGERWNSETQEMEFLLTESDFEKCRQGYGCSFCLCDYNGMYLMKCPDCGSDTFSVAETKDPSFRVVNRR